MGEAPLPCAGKLPVDGCVTVTFRQRMRTCPHGGEMRCTSNLLTTATSHTTALSQNAEKAERTGLASAGGTVPGHLSQARVARVFAISP